MSVSDISSKRVTEERDNAVTQLGVAFLNSEELKGERDALQSENDLLRNEVDALRVENEELQARLAQYEQQSQRFQKAADRALRAENTTRGESEKTQARRVEEKKLKEDNENLKAQVAQSRALREEEVRRRNRKEAELRSRIDSRDDTIQQLQGMTPQEMNAYLRNENEKLRVQMAELEAEREDDEQEWARKEARLKRKIEKSQEATRDAQDVTKELLSARRSSRSRREKADNKIDEAIRRASLPAKAERARSKAGRRSLPIYVDSESEADSTTDLDAFSHLRKGASLMSGAIPGLEKRPEHTGDTTELSFMARDEVARLRKALEEERAAARRQSRAPSKTRQGQDETVRSQSLPRKSSMKDLTTASRPMDLTESITGRIVSTALEDNRSAPASPTKQDTQRSILSNSGRRRPRSAPNDVTSAFILPDITMDIRNIPQPAPHDKGNCTVCHKSACAEHQTSAATDPSPPIPTTVPVSERVSADDIDATLRPTQPAPLALATVIKELQDELTHLNLQKAALDAVLRTHDASMAKRKRKAVEAKIAKLLHAISVKSDQIYALYDVVESQPYEQQQGPHQADDGDNEREVEETLLSVGIDPDEMRQRTRAKARSGADGLRSNKAKRVVIESVGGRSEDGAAAAAADDVSALLDDESELPWEGISETDLAA
ncbi:centrosome microtubule-binding domain of Cep57-domain-containing protein [Phyllosticta citrichinensis]|uniref:Centrosome microtubule-binding domain of Cep57-domain-containing protein n=1 Tax=Phyllosticta citrichinensis TaxID=1130410 RepID=A0ABR1Y6K0_9PEZI